MAKTLRQESPETLKYGIFIGKEYKEEKECPEKHRWPCREAINWGLDDIEEYWYALDAFERVAIISQFESILMKAGYLPIIVSKRILRG